MENIMEKDSIIIKTEIYIMETGSKVINQVLVIFILPMMVLHSMGNISKVKNTEKEFSRRPTEVRRNKFGIRGN